MNKLSEEQKIALRKWMSTEAETLISSDDVNDVLDALDELYLDLLDIDQEPTPESREVETRRDCIHWDNTH